jgi:hypothetical protein
MTAPSRTRGLGWMRLASLSAGRAKFVLIGVLLVDLLLLAKGSAAGDAVRRVLGRDDTGGSCVLPTLAVARDGLSGFRVVEASNLVGNADVAWCFPFSFDRSAWAVTEHVEGHRLVVQSVALEPGEEPLVRGMVGRYLEKHYGLGYRVRWRPDVGLASGDELFATAIWIGYVHDAAAGLVAASLAYSVACVLTRAMWARSRAGRLVAGLCPGCGYDMVGSGGGVCPECGASVAGHEDAEDDA